VPETLSQPLRDLLSKLLDRDPSTRATIPSLWDDPWLTSNGSDPLPDYDENVSSEIDEPSPAELHHALAVYRGSTFLALSAAAKFKGLLTAAATRRASAEKEASLDGTTTPPNGTGSGATTPALVDSPSSSPILEPMRNLSPNSAGGGRPGSRKAPRRFDTVSSLSIGETDEDDDGRGNSRSDEGGNTSTITTPDRANREEDETEVLGGISKDSGVPDFERDGQTWEEPE